MVYNQTFAMIKPGSVHRGLVGNIISRFEHKGLTIIGMKMIKVTREQAFEHYSAHKDKPFFNNLIECITSAPVVALVIQGENAIDLVRIMAGSTNPLESLPGTIRGDYSANIENNIIHTADSVDSAKREINIYFSKKEIQEYKRITEKWAFEFEHKNQ